jgi:hypothetical protein
MKWSEMTSKQRDMLVAVEVMGYASIMCDVEWWDEQWVTIHNDGYAVCNKCSGRGHIGYENEHPEAFRHQIIPPLLYTTDMNAALLVADHESFHGWMLSASKPWRTIEGVSRRGKVNEYECTLHLSSVSSNLAEIGKSISAAESICIAALRTRNVKIE